MIGWPPYRGDQGIPQRAMTSSRSPYRGGSDDRRDLVGENAKEQREVPCTIMACAKPVTDSRFTVGERDTGYTWRRERRPFGIRRKFATKEASENNRYALGFGPGRME